MKLTYLAYQRLPTAYAHGYQITKMCTAFAAAGLDVTLVHPRYHSQHQGPPESLAAFYGLEPAGFRQCIVPTFAYRWHLRHRYRLVMLASLLSIARAHHRYVATQVGAGEIVYTRDWHNLRRLARLRDRRGFKLVVELHSLPQRAIRHRVAALSQADLLVPISAALRDAFVALGAPAGRMLVEHDGFDAAEFEALPTLAAARGALGLADGFLIAFLGSFKHVAGDKGAGLLVDGLALLGDLPDLSLHLVGSLHPEVEAAALGARAAALGLPLDRLRVWGRAGRADVVRWLAACDVCVNPLPDHEHNRLASPLKVFEYMAAARPIVATNLPGMAEVLHHERNALLVPPGDAPALAAAIRRLHDDPALAQRLATQARTDVQQYTWDRRVQRILARLA